MSSDRICCHAQHTFLQHVDLEVAKQEATLRPWRVCQSGWTVVQAVRKNRYVILPGDFEKGYKSNVKKSENEFEFYK
jgi:hypothetical protein